MSNDTTRVILYKACNIGKKTGHRPPSEMLLMSAENPVKVYFITTL